MQADRHRETKRDRTIETGAQKQRHNLDSSTEKDRDGQRVCNSRQLEGLTTSTPLFLPMVKDDDPL